MVLNAGEIFILIIISIIGLIFVIFVFWFFLFRNNGNSTGETCNVDSNCQPGHYCGGGHQCVLGIKGGIQGSV